MAVRFNNSIISQVQHATDIVEMVSEHLSLAKKGKEFVGLCPFHADHTPSMYVNPVKQIFKCFACGAGGDVFKFVQLRENLNFPEAVERLAKRAGIKLEPLRKSPAGDSKRDKSQFRPKHVAKVNAWAQQVWQGDLEDEHIGATARKYIEERRISCESAKQWGLGLAPDAWDGLVKAARDKKIPDKLLLEAGLAVAKEDGGYYDKFRNRLMFPIMDVTGRTVGFGGRTLGSDPAKYMNSPATVLFDKSNSLYGLNNARHEIVSSGTAIVVEGYTDVIMCYQFGCKNVVATLGTSFTAGHGRLLRRYAKRIVLVFDSDTAGMAAANRALEVCLTEKIDIKLAFVAQGQDPCDFILSQGLEAFERVIAEAVDVMEFKWKRLVESLEASDNLADKRAATEEYLQTVARAMRGGRIDPITKGLIVGKLSGIIGLDKEQINRQLDRLHGRVARADSFALRNQRVVCVNTGDGFLAKAQREILEVLLNEPKLFEKIAEQITVEIFSVPVLREIAEVVFDSLRSGKQANLADLLVGIESTEGGSVIVELAQTGEKKGNYERKLEEAVSVVERHIEDTQKSRIKAGLNDEETASLQKINKILTRKNKGDQRNPGMITM